MAPREVITTLTPDQLAAVGTEVSQRLSTGKANSIYGRLNGNIERRCLIAGGAAAGYVEMASIDWNNKKQRAAHQGFTIQIRWGEADPSGRRRAVVETVQALLINDRIAWEPDHNQARNVIGSLMKAWDPSLVILEEPA